MRVLLADDSGTMRTIIRRSLMTFGIRDVVEAIDGEQAIELISSNEFDLILTDWNMPRKSGLDVLLSIRAQDKNVPVIMITTEAEKRRVLDAIKGGVSDYLIKPFTSTILEQKIQRFAIAK